MQEEVEEEPTYQLALCDLYHPLLHGFLLINKDIYNHFLIYTTYEPNEFYDDSYNLEEDSFKRYRLRQNRLMQLKTTHPSLRNYTLTYTRLEIVQYHIVSYDGSRYHVAILKTFWLRIVQRCWKKVYKARQDILKKRKTIHALRERERTGLWPKGLRVWPRFTVL
jgi:hypothetical protein